MARVWCISLCRAEHCTTAWRHVGAGCRAASARAVCALCRSRGGWLVPLQARPHPPAASLASPPRCCPRSASEPICSMYHANARVVVSCHYTRPTHQPARLHAAQGPPPSLCAHRFAPALPSAPTRAVRAVVSSAAGMWACKGRPVGAARSGRRALSIGAHITYRLCAPSAERHQRTALGLHASPWGI